MKEKNSKRPTRAIQYEEDYWVDVHDDAQMVAIGIRMPKASSRDESVWTKSPQEKALLRKVRNAHFGDMRFRSKSYKRTPVWAKLIIYLEKNKVYPYTTYSTSCWQHDIPQILGMYRARNKEGQLKSIVSKYVYNGKTYKPGELPYWR